MSWEYKYVEVPDRDWDKVLDFLNEAGAEGWEFTGKESDTGHSQRFLMKRQVVIEENPCICLSKGNACGGGFCHPACEVCV